MVVKASQKVWRKLEGQLWAKVLIALGAGLIFGSLLGPDLHLVGREGALQIANWVALPGYFFLAVIQMVVIPLVVASVVCGIAAGENVETIRSMGFKIVFYFLATTTVAVTIGGTLAHLIAPGDILDVSLVQSISAVDVNTSDALTDTSNIPKRIVGLIPRNPFGAFAAGEMLQIVIFAAVLGAALLFMEKKKAAPLLNVMQSMQEACMVVVGWILKLAPIAVFGLICQLMAKLGMDALYGMGIYMGTVILGLLCMLGLYIGLIIFVSKKNVREFFSQIREAQLIAFSTSSSSATMPVTLRTAEDQLKIKPGIARFIVPLGTTINMDGTALYQTIATVFLAQVFSVDIGFFGMLAILITAIAASIGTPGAPGVGIVVLASILATVGVPAEGIAIIVGVDRILDMCRTTINVTGDLVACTLMEKWLKK